MIPFVTAIEEVELVAATAVVSDLSIAALTADPWVTALTAAVRSRSTSTLTEEVWLAAWILLDKDQTKLMLASEVVLVTATEVDNGLVMPTNTPAT